MIYKTYYNSPLGKIILVSDKEFLLGLYFENVEIFKDNYTLKDDIPVFKETKKWLDSYFNKEIMSIDDIPIKLVGSKFRLKVWNILKTIPYGKTITYGEIAKILESKTGKKVSSQAVGGAVGHNPISIIIPCHRVIGKNNKLTGYSGGLDKKEFLLKLENIIK